MAGKDVVVTGHIVLPNREQPIMLEPLDLGLRCCCRRLGRPRAPGLPCCLGRTSSTSWTSASAASMQSGWLARQYGGAWSHVAAPHLNSAGRSICLRAYPRLKVPDHLGKCGGTVWPA